MHNSIKFTAGIFEENLVSNYHFSIHFTYLVAEEHSGKDKIKRWKVKQIGVKC